MTTWEKFKKAANWIYWAAVLCFFTIPMCLVALNFGYSLVLGLVVVGNFPDELLQPERCRVLQETTYPLGYVRALTSSSDVGSMPLDDLEPHLGGLVTQER